MADEAGSDKKKPRIVSLGGFDRESWGGSTESDANKPIWDFTDGELEIETELWPFIPNQNAEFLIHEDGIIELTVLQEGSTPGIRLELPINMPPGNYELTVVANSERTSTFFPWAMDNDGVRLTPTIHIRETEEPVSVNFRVDKESKVIFGILSHRQEQGDKCYIRSIYINKLQTTDDTKSKGNFHNLRFPNFVAHQNTELSDSKEGIVVSSKPISTPGTYSLVDVSPSSTVSIRISVSVSFPSVCFLYVADADTGSEVINRNTIFESRDDEDSDSPSELFSSFTVPKKTSRIRIGLLFSTVTQPEEHVMVIHKFEVCQHHELTELVDKAYVLNLKSESEKLAHCNWQAHRLGWELFPWSAVDGNSGEPNSDWLGYMDSPWSDYDKLLGRKAIDKPGAWGYLLSMKGIFKDAIAKGYRAIAVFDDDFVLSNSFDHRFSKLMEFIGDHWKVIYLGASQWRWDEVEVEANPFYRPDENTNGTFSVVYHHSIFEEILAEIEKMDAPFDAGALRRVVLGSGRDESFVASPSLSIAKLEKTGIRESRNQVEFSKRFGWNLNDFPPWFNQWEPNPVLLRDEGSVQGNSHTQHFLTAVTTVNRLSYLQKFISEWSATRDRESRSTLVVADDGSTDGTIEWLTESLEPDGYRLVVIRNDGRGIARQTNSILDFIEKQEEDFDAAFFCNDDIRFLRDGWDISYFNSMSESGYSHLVYFNPDWKPPIHSETSPRSSSLKSHCSARDAMGCFYTLTPSLIRRLGFFDEEEFPVRGHSHIDYTLRACRLEANDSNFLFDIENSNQYIGMEMREGYKRTHRNLTVREKALTTSEESLNKRESVLLTEGRIYVPRNW